MSSKKQQASTGVAVRDANGRFAKGNKTGGRPAGSPNKLSGTVRDAIFQSLEERGGVEYLNGLPDELFIKLLERVLPTEISATLRRGLADDLNLSSPAPSPEELEQALRVRVMSYCQPAIEQQPQPAQQTLATDSESRGQSQTPAE